MKKLVLTIVCSILCLMITGGENKIQVPGRVGAKSPNAYYTVYEKDNPQNVVFVRGDKVEVGDMYLSGDNKLYEIVEVEDETKTGYAKFLSEEKLPSYKVKHKNTTTTANAKAQKTVGLYHTHNDESYYDPDKTDSVYGKGGIHDVGKALKNNFEKLGINAVYSEDLHLPHNSGAYSRSQVTAAALIENNNLDGIFDIHRDSTPRSEYITKVDSQTMSKVRMVVGKASANYDINKEFAYSIKAYADAVYPNFIKDVYFGKGNYNQQLSPRSMLFEFGSENIEKQYAIKSTEVLAKVLDVVLYGSNNASQSSLADAVSVSENGESGDVVIEGLAYQSSTASIGTLWAILGAVGFYLIVLGVLCLTNPKIRYKTGRFFSELFAGIFGKKKAKQN